MYLQYAVIVILILLLVFMSLKEGFTTDQIARESSHPEVFKWYGNSEKDMLGMSPKDYYLQNQMLVSTGSMPALQGDDRFINHTGYLDMPSSYRRQAQQDAELQRKLMGF
jgi:hypothetical protein